MFQIYLNFTAYNLAKPNECEENYIQIFGRELEEEKKWVFFFFLPNKTWLNFVMFSISNKRKFWSFLSDAIAFQI